MAGDKNNYYNPSKTELGICLCHVYLLKHHDHTIVPTSSNIIYDGGGQVKHHLSECEQKQS